MVMELTRMIKKNFQKDKSSNNGAVIIYKADIPSISASAVPGLGFDLSKMLNGELGLFTSTDHS